MFKNMAVSKTVFFIPNTIESHQISKKKKKKKPTKNLSPKHAARGVVQSPYPIYRHGKACCLNKPHGVQLGTLA